MNTTLYKRHTNKKQIEEIKIEPNFDGLLNYFTARNIRSKIRHPLFLALKFAECVRLYYNTELVLTNKVRIAKFIDQRNLSKATIDIERNRR